MTWAFLTVYAVIAILLSVGASITVFVLVLNKRLTPDLIAFFILPVGTSLVFLFGHRDLTVDQGLALSMASSGWSGRIINPLCLVLCLVALIQIFIQKIRITAAQLMITGAIVAYYVTCFILPVWFDNPSYYGHAILYPLAAIPLILCPSSLDTTETAKYISRFTSFPAFLSLILLVFNFKGVVQVPYDSIIPFFDGRLHGATLHANVLGAITAFSILVTVAYSGQTITERTALVILNAIALTLAQSKTSIISTIVSVAILMLTRIRFASIIQRPTFILLLTALTSVGAAYFSIGTSSGYTALSDNKTIQSLGTLTGRVDIWRASMYLIQQHPIRGPGWGNWVDFITSLYPTYVAMPHNLYLTTMIQSGVIGLISLGVFLLVLILASARLRSKDRLFAFAYLTMLAIHGVSESYTFQLAFTAPTFWILLMFLRLLSQGDSNENSPKNSLVRSVNEA